MSKSTKTVMGAMMASVLMVASLNLAFAKPEHGPHDPSAVAERQEKMLNKMQTELQLSDDQVKQMQAVLDKNQAEMDKLRTQMKELHESMQADMKKIMTEEQQAKFDEMKAEKKAKMEGKKGKKDKDGKPGGRNNH